MGIAPNRGTSNPNAASREARRRGKIYMMEQMERLSEAFLAASATRVASVKASLTPRFFIAEHSVGSQ
jgi:hypothetical protein